MLKCEYEVLLIVFIFLVFNVRTMITIKMGIPINTINHYKYFYNLNLL